MTSRGGWRRPIVGVMGSGRHAHAARATRLGVWLAEEGVHLLTGGGGGVMAAVSEAFAGVRHRAGAVIGVLPAADGGGLRAPEGYPNPWVELPIYTHLPATGVRGLESGSRNHVNVLTADVVVGLPGSAGTASEMALAVRYGRPVVAYVGDRSEIPGLPDEVAVEGDFGRLTGWVRAQLRRGPVAILAGS